VRRSVEESEDFTTDVRLSSFDMVKHTLVGGEDDESELSGWEDLSNEVLELLDWESESWGDNTALVESSVKINNNLSGSSIIDDLEVTDVTLLLHLSEELDDNLRDWSQDNLNINVRIHKSNV
jgi:hypothetical protein